MKKIIFTLTVLTTMLPALALAQGSPFEKPNTNITNLVDKAAGEAGYNTSRPISGLATTIGYIVRAFLTLIGVIFMAYTLYGGFLWMTAGGGEEKVTKAKDIIRNGIIGMIVVFSVVGIYYVVEGIFNPEIRYQPPTGF